MLSDLDACWHSLIVDIKIVLFPLGGQVDFHAYNFAWSTIQCICISEVGSGGPLF